MSESVINYSFVFFVHICARMNVIILFVFCPTPSLPIFKYLGRGWRHTSLIHGRVEVEIDVNVVKMDGAGNMQFLGGVRDSKLVLIVCALLVFICILSVMKIPSRKLGICNCQGNLRR